MKNEYPSLQIVQDRKSAGFTTEIVGHRYVICLGPRDPGMTSNRQYKSFDGCLRAGERVIKRIKENQDEER